MIREYKPEDLDRLKQVHQAQGFNYPFPDIEGPTFLKKLVIEEEGKVVMAAAARLTTEIFLFVDPGAGTALQRWRRLCELHPVMERALWLAGADDMHCFVPPEIAHKFGRRLLQLGWTPDTEWPCYSKPLGG